MTEPPSKKTKQEEPLGNVIIQFKSSTGDDTGENA